MATRRSSDYNRPLPWASKQQVDAISDEWKAEADPHIHPFEVARGDSASDLWSQYGMSRVALADSRTHDVYTGYYIAASPRSATVHEPWHGGIGTYYSWRTIIDWERWPRRQDALSSATPATRGNLLLFISHRWELLAHPDPTGRQLLATKVGLALSLAAALRLAQGARTASGLPEVVHRFLAALMPDALTDHALAEWADHLLHAARDSNDEQQLWQKVRAIENATIAERLDAIRSRVLIWYDYASMHQAPRSESEQSEFRREIEMLNQIQAGATTVVISTDGDYEWRAWCFLEICGGIRKHIVEITPSWGRSLGISSSRNRWSHISDQLIAALTSHGLASIEGTALRATEAGDLAIVASLIAHLPLLGLVESDSSDLVGGSIPMPFRDGRWITSSTLEAPAVTEHTLPAREDFGVLPDASQLEHAVEAGTATGELRGAAAVWIYTTQRVLSLSWTARAQELCSDLAACTSLPPVSSVACAWADSRSLGDDGSAWTRCVPSVVSTLIVITQADLPAICRIYESVVNAHLTAGGTVVTYSPETGSVKVSRPISNSPPPDVGRVANAIVVRRARRTTAMPEYLLLQPGLTREHLLGAAALRLDPSDPSLASLHLESTDLDRMSRRRSIVEAVARSNASCWEAVAHDCFTAQDWADPADALHQLAAIEQLVAGAQQGSSSPLECRARLYGTLFGGQERGEVMTFNLPEVPAMPSAPRK